MVPQWMKWEIKRLTNFHRQGDQPNIFLFSTARSGSTWLMEMIATQKGIKFINEPFLMWQFRDGRGPLPGSWEFLLPNPDRKPRLERYFRDLISNRKGVGSPAPFTRYHRWFTRRIVFKILRCQDLINWFEKTFEAQIVYLVRHPIPVSLSRQLTPLLHGFLNSDLYCERFLPAGSRAYARSLASKGTEFQRKVLDWCLQNLPPLGALDRRRWLCLHYEDLVADAAGCIDRLATALGLREPEKLHRQVSVPSTSVFLSDRETTRILSRSGGGAPRSRLVSKWRARVSAVEEAQAFEILDRFGIHLYGPGEDMPVERL